MESRLPRVLHGDSREVLKTIADCSVDSCLTDPPYALVSIVKRFGKPNAAPAKGNDAYIRASSGFMGQQWDTGETAFDPNFWREVLRVLKPGAHLLAFSGTRTYHRMACAIEDAGFEIRDMCQWLYGSGFPKSHNMDGDWEGWGTALKPACEPLCLARKPLSEKTIAANVLRWGTGALNIDGCRIGYVSAKDAAAAAAAAAAQRLCHDDDDRDRSAYRIDSGPHLTESLAAWNNKQKLGRWPANICHDGSEEVVQVFPEAPGQIRATGPEFERNANVYGKFAGVTPAEPRDGGGSAARFFYAAKADAEDRIGAKHPTVKPVDLMQWYVRLITPPRGLVLDCFAGTGTTGEAAWREGFRSILIEREERFVADVHRRIDLMQRGPFERAGKLTSQEAAESLPLFAA